MKIRYFLVVAMVWGWSNLAHAQNLESYHWRPIGAMTNQEKEVIEIASRQSAEDILRNKLCFAWANNTLIILDNKGIQHFFAIGSRMGSVLAGDSHVKISGDDGTDLYDNKQAPRELNDQKLRELSKNFSDLWLDVYQNGMNSLNEADAAAHAYIAVLNEVLSVDKSFLNDGEIADQITRLAKRGTRYFDSIEPWLKELPVDSALFIYEQYLSADFAFLFDRPGSSDVTSILYKIGERALSNSDVLVKRPHLAEAMKQLTPDLYQKLTVKYPALLIR